MKREILFRGFGSGKWRYGYYVHFDERPLSVIYNPKFRDFIISQGKYGEHAIPVDPETVGQFTGYKDDEGQEIFEGDLIRYQYEDHDTYTGWHGLIEVTDEVVFEYGSFRLKNTYPFDIDNLWCMNNSKVNIIGNIHEK